MICLLFACTQSAAPPPVPGPLDEPLLLVGWPGPLRPELEPADGTVVELKAAPDPGAESSGKCVLAPRSPVRWTRSRVRVTRPGQLRFASDQVPAVPLPELKAARPKGLDAQTPITTDVKAGAMATVWARFAGTCLVEIARERYAALQCPTGDAELERAPEQSWWLEVGCSGGEGWFEVDTDVFRVQHFPGDLEAI